MRHAHVERLVASAKTNEFVLTSLMAKLHCESFAERALIPAFVFFFQMLYPFAWVNDSSARTAAAAGGCMLVERFALEKAGGVAKIRGALIDDCALARLMKTEGPIWLGLSDQVRSLRTYPEIGDIGQHGGPFGLCPTPLFAPTPRCNIGRHGRDLSRASSSRHYSEGIRPTPSPQSPGH